MTLAPIAYRLYQAELESRIYSIWDAGARKVLLVLPTGGGKTVIFAKILAQHQGPAIANAHRQELVGQISVALATLRVPHRIIAPNAVIRDVVQLQQQILGYSTHDPNAYKAVAGVDTLVRRKDNLGNWPDSVTLLVQDEDHHTLRNNKWGTTAELFPNAKNLGVTATPRRTDGKGLGRHADGLVDTMVIGPSMRDLINDGYLTDYRIFAPPNNLDLSDVNTTGTGEFSHDKLVTAVRRSRIMGDVVSQYLKHTPGKLGLVFATDVKTATDICKQFNNTGVPSEMINAKTPDRIRAAILYRFKIREVLVLVNVDIFGEGFDLPALEVVSMARPTQSLSLYMQQFGRALRPMDGKTHALIIDHAGNVMRHGLPDAPRTWSLEARDRRNGNDDGVIPVTVCPNCTGVYERIYKVCPYCGFRPVPADRAGPELVDGDLMELDAVTLAQMRGEIAAVDLGVEEYRAQLAAKHTPVIGQLAHVKKHAATQVAQDRLRAGIALWAGYWRDAGSPDFEIHRRFYFKFGIDIMSAQALREKNALALVERVESQMGRM